MLNQTSLLVIHEKNYERAGSQIQNWKLLVVELLPRLYLEALNHVLLKKVEVSLLQTEKEGQVKDSWIEIYYQ